MVLEQKFAKMLRKLGSLYTFKIAGAPTTTDSFYRNTSATYTEVSLRAVIFPARAYDVHSNIVHFERLAGVEEVGIIEIYLDQEDCPVKVEDFVKVETVWYKIVSKEVFSTSYYVFEGRVEAEP